MSALQDRTVLFKYTLDEFCAARRSAIVRSFIDALTRGGKYLVILTCRYFCEFVELSCIDSLEVCTQ